MGRSGFELDAEFGESVFEEERIEQGPDAGIVRGNDLSAREAGAISVEIDRSNPFTPIAAPISQVLLPFGGGAVLLPFAFETGMAGVVERAEHASHIPKRGAFEAAFAKRPM